MTTTSPKCTGSICMLVAVGAGSARASSPQWPACAGVFSKPVEGLGILPEEPLLVLRREARHHPLHRADDHIVADAQPGNRKVGGEEAALDPEDRDRIEHDPAV